jgi:hypothetical protein
MRLYHYTLARHVRRIQRKGLLTSLEQIQAPCPVVWLTTQPDVTVSPKDARVMAGKLGIYEGSMHDLRKMQAGEARSAPARPPRHWMHGESGGKRWTMHINGRECDVTYSGDKDDLVRLTVELPDNDPKLHRYVEWPRRVMSHVIQIFCEMDHVRQWHIYLGRVPPAAITDLTEAQDLTAVILDQRYA